MAVSKLESAEKTSVLTIRVPHELKERIEFMAEQQGVSINQFALYAFTKQLSEIENSEYFQQFIKNKTRQDLLAGFDKAMGKVKFRAQNDDWDALKVADSSFDSQKERQRLPKKTGSGKGNPNVSFDISHT